MPAIAGLFGSSGAAGLTVSLAPMTRTTSVSKSSLSHPISRTMSWGAAVSAGSTFMWRSSRPVGGCQTDVDATRPQAAVGSAMRILRLSGNTMP